MLIAATEHRGLVWKCLRTGSGYPMANAFEAAIQDNTESSDSVCRRRRASGMGRSSGISAGSLEMSGHQSPVRSKEASIRSGQDIIENDGGPLYGFSGKNGGAPQRFGRTTSSFSSPQCGVGLLASCQARLLRVRAAQQRLVPLGESGMGGARTQYAQESLFRRIIAAAPASVLNRQRRDGK